VGHLPAQQVLACTESIIANVPYVAYKAYICPGGNMINVSYVGAHAR
jgi:hypothetical protein